MTLRDKAAFGKFQKFEVEAQDYGIPNASWWINWYDVSAAVAELKKKGKIIKTECFDCDNPNCQKDYHSFAVGNYIKVDDLDSVFGLGCEKESKRKYEEMKESTSIKPIGNSSSQAPKPDFKEVIEEHMTKVWDKLAREQKDLEYSTFSYEKNRVKPASLQGRSSAPQKANEVERG